MSASKWEQRYERNDHYVTPIYGCDGEYTEVNIL